ncbi:hypothetical protein ACFYW1_08640 [Streptomyces sp. NPDC002669]|uniref:hypothetical protein n=1 Tax=unclassified Streptomyces TaxID=2593676 RepID=UPI0036B6ECE7
MQFIPVALQRIAIGPDFGVLSSQSDIDPASAQNGTHGDQRDDNQCPEKRALCKCHETHFKCHG